MELRIDTIPIAPPHLIPRACTSHRIPYLSLGEPPSLLSSTYLELDQAVAHVVVTFWVIMTKNSPSRCCSGRP